MNNIKVSVVVPVYNVEKYIVDCLDSLVKQTLQDIEIICVDDKSTDQSISLLKEYMNKDRRIHIVENSVNGGLSYARNRGFEKARGEYIYFLDSDDMLEPTALARLYKDSVENLLDGIFFGRQVFFENDRLRTLFPREVNESFFDSVNVLTGPEMFKSFLKVKKYDPSINLQFWRRSYLLEQHFEFYEGIYHEDYPFTFSAMLSAKRVKCIKEKYHLRRRREESITTIQYSMKHFAGRFIGYWEQIFFLQKITLPCDIYDLVVTYLSDLHDGIWADYQKFTNFDERRMYRFEDPLLEMLFEKEKNHFDTENTLISEIDKIKRYKHILIYGAGKIGHRVIEILGKNKIEQFRVVVSEVPKKRQFIMGNPIYLIDDFINLRDEAIVLVAVTAKYQKDILDKLSKLGFQHIILAIKGGNK